MDVKTYIKIFAVFSPDGDISPLFIEWDDGRKFIIDKILQKSKESFSPHPKESTMRYVVMISGNQKELWYETNTQRWFVESK